MADISLGVRYRIDEQSKAELLAGVRRQLGEVSSALAQDRITVGRALTGATPAGSYQQIGQAAAGRAQSITEEALESGTISRGRYRELRDSLRQVNQVVTASFDERSSELRRRREAQIQETVRLSDRMQDAERRGMAKEAAEYKRQLQEKYKQIPSETEMRAQVDEIARRRNAAMASSRGVLPMFGPGGVPIEQEEPERGKGRMSGLLGGAGRFLSEWGVPLGGLGLAVAVGRGVRNAFRAEQEDWQSARGYAPSEALATEGGFTAWTKGLTVPFMGPQESRRALRAYGLKDQDEARVGAMTAFGLGVEPEEGGEFFRLMRRVGRQGGTGGADDARAMARLIGETIGETQMRGRAGEMFDAISGFAMLAGRTMATAPNPADYLGLMRRLSWGAEAGVKSGALPSGAEAFAKGEYGGQVLGQVHARIAGQNLVDLPDVMGPMMMMTMQEGGVTSLSGMRRLGQQGLMGRIGEGPNAPFFFEKLMENFGPMLADPNTRAVVSQSMGLPEARLDLFEQMTKDMAANPNRRGSMSTITPETYDTLLKGGRLGDLMAKLEELQKAGTLTPETGQAAAEEIAQREPLAVAKATQDLADVQTKLHEAFTSLLGPVGDLTRAMAGVAEILGGLHEKGTGVARAVLKFLGASDETADKYAGPASAVTIGALGLKAFSMAKGLLFGGGAAKAAGAAASAAGAGAAAGTLAFVAGGLGTALLAASGSSESPDAQARSQGAMEGWEGTWWGRRRVTTPQAEQVTTPQAEQASPSTTTGPPQGDSRGYLSRLQGIIRAAAKRHNIPEGLVSAVIGAESFWKPKAVSPKGAQGLMQLMPGTARDMGVTKPFDPEQNVEGGVKYLRLMLDKTGNEEDALRAYNMGPAAFDAWKKRGGRLDDLPKETREYPGRVAAFRGATVDRGSGLAPPPFAEGGPPGWAEQSERRPMSEEALAADQSLNVSVRIDPLTIFVRKEDGTIVESMTIQPSYNLSGPTRSEAAVGY